MAQSKVLSEKIQEYCIAAGSNLIISEHAKWLKSLGAELDLTAPSEVSEHDLKNLERALVALKAKMLEEENTKINQVKKVKSMIADVSWLGQTKSNKRTKKMVKKIENLGAQIITLSGLLSISSAPILIQQFIDQLFSN